MFVYTIIILHICHYVNPIIRQKANKKTAVSLSEKQRFCVILIYFASLAASIFAMRLRPMSAMNFAAMGMDARSNLANNTSAS